MPARKCPPDSVLKAMYDQGKSPGMIAKELGLNVNTVAGRLCKMPGHVMRSSSEAQKLAFKNGKKPQMFWKGKKQPAELVEKRVSKIRGKNHYLWKGGLERRPYRDQIKKVKCSKCGSKLNLCIHHIDFDHYNNEPDNLQVLCVGCHLRLHKKHYWDRYRAGIPHEVSTAPHHWTKRKEGQ